MLDFDGKLFGLETALIADVKAEAEALRAGTDAEERRQLAEYEALLRAAAEKRRAAAAAEARNREERRAVAESLRLRREVLELRERCAEEVLDEVRRRLAALTAAPDYGALLRGLLARALAAVPGADEAELLLRPADMAQAPALAAAAPGIRLTCREGGFALGGLMLSCPAQNRRVDLSFDSALADLSGRFAEVAGLHGEGADGS